MGHIDPEQTFGLTDYRALAFPEALKPVCRSRVRGVTNDFVRLGLVPFCRTVTLFLGWPYPLNHFSPIFDGIPMRAPRNAGPALEPVAAMPPEVPGFPESILFHLATSRTCPWCEYIVQANRKTQAHFVAFAAGSLGPRTTSRRRISAGFRQPAAHGPR
jgi:hypothetical protein